MEPSEGQPRLGRRTRRRHYRRALLARPLHDCLEQRRLTDSCLTAHNVGAPSCTNPIDNPEEPLLLQIAPDEPPTGEPYSLLISTGDTQRPRPRASRRRPLRRPSWGLCAITAQIMRPDEFERTRAPGIRPHHQAHGEGGGYRVHRLAWSGAPLVADQ